MFFIKSDGFHVQCKRRQKHAWVTCLCSKRFSSKLKFWTNVLTSYIRMDTETNEFTIGVQLLLFVLIKVSKVQESVRVVKALQEWKRFNRSCERQFGMNSYTAQRKSRWPTTCCRSKSDWTESDWKYVRPGWQLVDWRLPTPVTKIYPN